MVKKRAGTRGRGSSEPLTVTIEVPNIQHVGPVGQTSQEDILEEGDSKVEVVPAGALATPMLDLATTDNAFAGQENPVLSYLGRLSEGSRRTMRGSLEEIAKVSSGGKVGALDFPWWKLNSTHTAMIRGYLDKKYAPSTANKMLSALKGVCKACFRLGLMTADERDRALDIAPIRGTRLPPGRSIEEYELASLFGSCAKDADDQKLQARGVRDATMLALLYIGGLRRAELANLKLGDYDPETRTLLVHGKGNKERAVYAEGDANVFLDRWLEIRGDGEPEDPLFLPVSKTGRVEHTDPYGEKKTSLSDQAVYKIVRRRHQEAKVKKISPHDFRKTFVSDLLDAGVDLATVQSLAGHSNPATTARYDRRGERAARAGVSKLNIPRSEDFSVEDSE